VLMVVARTSIAPGKVWMKGKSNVDRRKFH
jgi:hypothetical protein